MIYTSEVLKDVLFLSMEGDLLGDANDFTIVSEVENQLNNNILLCAVDISRVKFMNSTGVGVLITILTKFRNREGEVYLINPSEQVKKLLIITKLYAIFNVSDSKIDAIGKLKGEVKSYD